MQLERKSLETLRRETHKEIFMLYSLADAEADRRAAMQMIYTELKITARVKSRLFHQRDVHGDKDDTVKPEHLNKNYATFSQYVRLILSWALQDSVATVFLFVIFRIAQIIPLNFDHMSCFATCRPMAVRIVFLAVVITFSLSGLSQTRNKGQVRDTDSSVMPDRSGDTAFQVILRSESERQTIEAVVRNPLGLKLRISLVGSEGILFFYTTTKAFVISRRFDMSYLADGNYFITVSARKHLVTRKITLTTIPEVRQLITD